MLKNLTQFFLNTLFPIKCIYCSQKFDVFLCEDCLKKIVYIENQTCPVCKTFNEKGDVCIKCRSVSMPDGLIAMCEYNHIISELLQAYKYNGIAGVEAIINFIVASFFKRNSLKMRFYIDDCVIVPIPLHKKRLQEREFNQSEVIANIVASHLNTPVNKTLLKRIKNTPKQSLLSKEKRIENIQNAFAIDNIDIVHQRNVLLIDDVYTTGSTMQECVRVLKDKANFKKIYGLVLAKGKINR